MGEYGIVEIDGNFTWWIKNDLEDRSTKEIADAFKLTFNPPHPVDGGFGWRALGDVRETLGDVLVERGALHEHEEDGVSGWKLTPEFA